MRFWTIIALILVLSAVGLTYEIAAGRVLAPFFGTSLLTWTTVIAAVLAGFSVGSALGGLIAERDRAEAMQTVRKALLATAVLMALSPLVLGTVYTLGARGTWGMAVSVVVAFFPASVLVTLPSPLLAKLAVEARPGREGSSLGLVLAAGSVGAIAGAVLSGFVTLPLIGSAATFTVCGAVTLACLPVLRAAAAGRAGDATRLGSLVAAAFVVGGSLLAGPICRYESGLSCLDVTRQGRAVFLVSDGTAQAAERPGAGPGDALVLSYTQWLWQRMDRDLGPAPSVLFIGGGGYTLPARLLEDRPAARAVAVEIDPLVTEVVRRHLPRAGAMIAETGFDLAQGGESGRLGILHADGRVFINETDLRFDAAVMDAFSSSSVPAHLATRETYARLREIVDGPVYVNLLDRPDGRLARGIHAILTELYPHVRAVQSPIWETGRANIVMIAADAPITALDDLPTDYAVTQISDARAFTDDRGWSGHR
ncbi:fused MFS/spermidine synthase [Roseivivax sp. CAU 1761]